MSAVPQGNHLSCEEKLARFALPTHRRDEQPTW